jgi:ABC-2 type transport system permease protein
MGGILTAYRGEVFKLAAQKRTWLGITAAVVGPVIYLLLAIAQGYPRAPLADNLGHTGVGFALVVFKLILVVGPAIVVALVAGDIVAAEDADGTLKTILTRSLRRSDVLAGKLLALALDVPAVIVYCMPVLAIASCGLFLSVLTRQSVAAVGGTLIYAMGLQGVAVIAAIRAAHPYLLTNQLTAWHGLFQTPVAGGAILRSAFVSAAFALPPLIAAFVTFNRRDVTA